jgi:hypothetical protein
MTDDESAPAPRMRPELTALVNWLRSSGRMADVDYGRLLHEIVAIGWRAAFMAAGHGHVEGLTSAARAVQTHLEATVVDHDPAALAFLLEGLIPLTRFVGDNPYGSSSPSVCSPTRRSSTGSTRQRGATRLLPPERSWGS